MHVYHEAIEKYCMWPFHLKTMETAIMANRPQRTAQHGFNT